MKNLCILLFAFIISAADSVSHMPDFSLPGLDIENRHLDNSQCTNGVMYRLCPEVSCMHKDGDPRVPRNWNPDSANHIVLRYTHCSELDELLRCHRTNGTSSHFVVLPDGRIICLVNPNSAIS
ncbi:MAG: hypothetical protein LBL30_00620 [Holosporales bacterium]|jgi:N-acetyl-anhydromuramyl-L-alanine amidase AmpD|nr:hypothetical protein [Holosporales bacterium]